MRINSFKLFSATACLFVAANLALAQRSASPGPASLRLSEVSTLKRKAESGNQHAQLALGQSFATHDRPVDALAWYRKAAAQGSVEAAWLAGELLLLGKPANDESQRLAAQPEAGVALVFSAATNRHAAACRMMSILRQRGWCGRTNLVEAYAWLRIYAEADPVRRKKELDTLGLTLTVPQLDQADKLIREFNRGKWPALELRHDYKQDSRLKLSGVTIGGRFPLAIINRRTFAEGESASIPVAGGTVSVKCLKISEDSVLVAVDQEPEPRLISLY